MSGKGKSHKAYPPEFKSRCVREPLDGDETLSQVTSRNGIAPSPLSKRGSQVLENMDAVFGAEAERRREAEAERIEAGTSNSSIRFEQLRAAGYSFTSSNGSIGGTLPGELGDYAVQSGTSNGRNDLPAHSEGVIPLSVHTSNSSIRIGFAGKAEKTPEETGDSTEKSVD